MTAPTKPTFYIVDAAEPVFVSWMRDIVSFGMLAATTWFVNAVVPSSGWINFIIALTWFLWMLGRSMRHRQEKTAAQMREWLDEHYPHADESTRPEPTGAAAA